MQNTVVESPEDVVMLIDEQPLRRAAYGSLLAPWASERGLRVIMLGLADFEQSAPAATLVVISGGSTSVKELRLREEPFDVALVRAPVVVVSDRNDASEVIAAIALGVKGFLPTKLPADLALKALTFVLGGGDFFPPSALRSTAEATPSARHGVGWKYPVQHEGSDD